MEYTAEQLNYFRICYVAFNLVPGGLRKIFKQEWDFRYKTSPLGEWKDTSKNGLDFDNNESKRSRAKNARFLATIKNGNTAEWDCSCLFFAILYSDSIGATLSPAINKYVDDLRQVRNDIAHISEAELTDVDFKNYVGRVVFAFNCLGLPINEIEDVKNQTTFPTAEVNSLKIQADHLKAELGKAKTDLQVAQNTIQAQEEQVETLTKEINSKVKSFCNLTFKPSHEIITRHNEVTRITKKMEELKDGSDGAVSTIYLSGTPGCGKSQIARQLGQEFFTRRSRKSEPSGLVFVATLDAESLETLADSYIALAKKLGITEYALTNLAISKVERPKETLQHLKLFTLSKTKEFSDWLVIVDNVVDLSLVRSYLPETGSEEWGKGQLLITTQDPSAIPFNARYIYHESLNEGMQPDDAVQLLKHVSLIGNQEQAEKVAQVLEYQPLALAAAAFYVQTVVRNGSPNYSWSKYLETLEQGKREATEEPLAKENIGYAKTMTTAIKLALNRTIETDEILRHTFFFIQLCSSESLPIEAAVDFADVKTTGQTEELIKAKIVKSPFILCSCEEKEALPTLRVHNTVREVLQNVALYDPKSTERFESLAAAIRIFNSLIDKEIALSSHEGYTFAPLKTIVLHCKEILEKASFSSSRPQSSAIKNLTPFIAIKDVIRWICSSADLCCKLSDPSRANFFSNCALNLLDNECGNWQENSVKAHVFTVHGKVLSMQCQPERSIPYHEEALRILDTIQSEDKLSVVITNYNNLGKVYKATGKHDKAIELLQKALDICKITHGENDIHAATSLSHLGLVYNDLGQHEQAIELHHRALVIRKKAFGEDHGDVAASYNNLGIVFYDRGQYNQANEMHERALTIRRKIFGEEHCDVAASYNNLGLVACRNKQYSQAKVLHEKALKLRRKVFGEDHGDVFASFNNLGLVCFRLEQYEEALEMDRKAVMIGEKIFPLKPCLVASYNHLGLVLHALARYAEAKMFYEKALIIQRKHFGEDDRQVATSYYKLALVSERLGQFDETEEYHQKALAIRETIFGDEHGDVAASYDKLGLYYLYTPWTYTKAKEFCEKALAIRKRTFGEKHLVVATSYYNLGLVSDAIGQYIRAEEYHKQALAMRKKIFGEEHHEVAASYYQLGLVSVKRGLHIQAKEYHKQALAIRRKVFGAKHDDVAASYEKLGAAFYNLGKYDKAIAAHSRARTIREELFGVYYRPVAKSYGNLGSTLYDLEQLDIDTHAISTSARNLSRNTRTIPFSLGDDSSGASIGKSAVGTYSNYPELFWVSPK